MHRNFKNKTLLHKLKLQSFSLYLTLQIIFSGRKSISRFHTYIGRKKKKTRTKLQNGLKSLSSCVASKLGQQSNKVNTIWKQYTMYVFSLAIACVHGFKSNKFVGLVFNCNTFWQKTTSSLHIFSLRCLKKYLLSLCIMTKKDG